MTRAGLAAALVVACGLAGAARAQDGMGGAGPDGRVTIEARALDFTAMLRSQHGRSGAAPEPIPLAGRPVSAVVRIPGATSRRVPGEGRAVTSGEDGSFRMELGELPPGASVHFFVEHGEDGADGPAGYYARPWRADDGEPLEDVRFFAVAADSRGVRQQVMQVVTAIEEGDVGSGRSIQVRHLAFVQNLSFEVWLGDFTSGQPVSYGIPIPEGFELRDVRVDGERLERSVVHTPHGGESFAYSEALFPTVPGDKDAYMFSAILVGPYDDGEVVDLSWHTELPVDEYRLNLQQPEFNYEPADGAPALQDGGAVPPMGNSPKPTHAWVAQGIPAHANVPATFRIGRPFPTRAVLVTLIILLAAAGAALLGRSLGRRTPAPDGDGDSAGETGGATDEGPDRGPAGGSARVTLAELDERLRRGEITSVEYEVRRRAVLGGAPPAPPAPAKPATQPPAKPTVARATTAAARGPLLERLDEIVRRAPDADLEQLRADVRALARAMREILEG